MNNQILDVKDGLKVCNRFQGVQIYSTLAAAGRLMFPDQPNLRGARIRRVEVYPEGAASYSLESGQQPVATDADITATVVTFVSGSDQIIEQMPLLKLNPQVGTGGAWVYDPTLFDNLDLDWNKCYIQIWKAPDVNPCYFNLGVWYDYPEDSQNGLQRNTGLKK